MTIISFNIPNLISTFAIRTFFWWRRQYPWRSPASQWPGLGCGQRPLWGRQRHRAATQRHGVAPSWRSELQLLRFVCYIVSLLVIVSEIVQNGLTWLDSWSLETVTRLSTSGVESDTPRFATGYHSLRASDDGAVSYFRGLSTSTTNHWRERAMNDDQPSIHQPSITNKNNSPSIPTFLTKHINIYNIFSHVKNWMTWGLNRLTALARPPWAASAWRISCGTPCRAATGWRSGRPLSREKWWRWCCARQRLGSFKVSRAE